MLLFFDCFLLFFGQSQGGGTRVGLWEQGARIKQADGLIQCDAYRMLGVRARLVTVP